ncbi:MAG TPA: FAD-dependent monooxygenase [Candidatus Dormibacteraeota bacterium]|nr:FAD-dependent monooxygenase [Candidatus Dormibacteraeota bacterium]
MRYAVIGGGAAGLYFALLAKKANPSDEVLVVERNPPDATFGWGVVFSEETLGALRDADYETYTEIGESFARWNAIDIYYRDTKIRSRGHVFTGISRKVLLNILQRRCRALGVRLEFEREVHDVREFEGADLIIGADGINGLVRRTYGEFFKPQVAVHPTKYVWFGGDLPLDAFTFIFRRNEHGLFQVHAYPFDARTCTFIVECPEDAWRRAGLESATEAESIAYCEALFQPELRGRRLMSNRSLWVNFLTLRQESWHHGNVVLLGDAAHTAHFSIGSGTKLAMEDSIALVDALRRHHDLGAALNDYEMERQPVVERFQEAAVESASYFEHVSRYAQFDPRQFAFNLLTRSRRITYVNLTQRDPELVRTVDSWFTAAATGSPDGVVRLSPPPMFAPLRIGNLTVPNRVAMAAGPDLEAAAQTGAGLLITEFFSVTEDGRITPDTPVIDRARQDILRSTVERIHQAGSRVALQLGHAGRRGSMRPRTQGVDRPLTHGGWRLMAASRIAYTPHAALPKEMTARDLSHLVKVFAEAARAAAGGRLDALELNFAHGYLVAGFISPLTNHRTDEYGGSLENRMRFPLEVLDAVRATWERPLFVRISASDWADGGIDLDESVSIAALLKAHGCDLVHVVMGQTIWESRPDYRRLFGVPASDRIRNEAGIPTIATGNITTADDVNTILAAGRADLCVLDTPFAG